MGRKKEDDDGEYVDEQLDERDAIKTLFPNDEDGDEYIDHILKDLD